jgi:hypothetical protein
MLSDPARQGDVEMLAVKIQLKDVYGRTVVYPVNTPGQLFASISGTKTLGRGILVRILALGFAIEVVDRFGNVSKTYEPGRVESLPQIV